MKRQLTALSLLLAFVTVFVLAPVTTATAQTASGFPVTAGTSTGGTFTGTIDIKKFKANGPNLVLDGTLSGTIRNADGTVVPVNKESVNNVVVEGANTSTSGTVQAVAGIDHGAGHPPLLRCYAKAPNYGKNKGFKDFANYSQWPKVAGAMIEALSRVRF